MKFNQRQLKRKMRGLNNPKKDFWAKRKYRSQLRETFYKQIRQRRSIWKRFKMLIMYLFLRIKNLFKAKKKVDDKPKPQIIIK